MPKEIEITEIEKKALEEYQDNYYKIVNTLLRKGITSEQTINSKNGKDYIAPSNEELEKAIDNIKNIYSAIIKSTLNGNNIEDKPLYRGTQITLIEQMRKNGEETSFLSTTTNKNQTRAFSRTFSKDKSVDTEYDKAFLKVEGNVPHINLEEFLGGMEDEVIFVPARAEIIDGIDGISDQDEKHTKLYGKPYTLKLIPLEIPEMSNQEILKLKESIFSRNEKMGKIIEAILQMQQTPDLVDAENMDYLIQQYSKWKDDVISYCHQEFRIIQKELEQNYLTEKLGKETHDEQNDTISKDEVENDMDMQMRAKNRKEQTQQVYQEKTETKTHTTENPESFRSRMRFEITQDQYQEILDMHNATEKNFANEMVENPDKRKIEQSEYEVR